MQKIQNLNQGRALRLLAICALMLAAFSGAVAQDTTAATGGNKAGVSTATNQAPTYLRDIQPIFMGTCSRCHNEQTRFVYDWLDYKTAYSDRWEIRRRVWNSWKGSYYKESMPVANSPESLALTDEQRMAIVRWVDGGGVKGAPPPPGAPKTKDEKIQAGKRLFTSICAACHQPTGKGLPNMFPPLAGSDYLNSDKKRAIETVLFGRRGEVVVNGQKFNNNMPSFPLTDDNVADVLTYVYNSFGNSGLEVVPEEVKILRAHPPAPGATPEAKNAFE
jgi:mono/diheme cytochrome c family protein